MNCPSLAKCEVMNMAVKAKAKGTVNNQANVDAAVKRYFGVNPKVLLAGNGNGMPVVVAHESEFKGRKQFRLQTLYVDRMNPQAGYLPGKGLTVPLEYKRALLEALAGYLMIQGYQITGGTANTEALKLLCGGTVEHSTAKL